MDILKLPTEESCMNSMVIASIAMLSLAFVDLMLCVNKTKRGNHFKYSSVQPLFNSQNCDASVARAEPQLLKQTKTKLNSKVYMVLKRHSYIVVESSERILIVLKKSLATSTVWSGVVHFATL